MSSEVEVERRRRKRKHRKHISEPRHGVYIIKDVLGDEHVGHTNISRSVQTEPVSEHCRTLICMRERAVQLLAEHRNAVRAKLALVNSAEVLNSETYEGKAMRLRSEQFAIALEILKAEERGLEMNESVLRLLHCSSVFENTRESCVRCSDSCNRRVVHDTINGSHQNRIRFATPKVRDQPNAESRPSTSCNSSSTASAYHVQASSVGTEQNSDMSDQYDCELISGSVDDGQAGSLRINIVKRRTSERALCKTPPLVIDEGRIKSEPQE